MGHAGIDTQGLYSPGCEILNLVLHQGDERGDDDGNPLPAHCRHLKTYGLSAPGRKNGKGIPSLKGRTHDVFLHGAETVITPIFFQYLRSCHQSNFSSSQTKVANSVQE